MAFITPTNNVKLLTGVPINNDYENTLYFVSDQARYAYFSSKVKYVNNVPLAWADISYQRYMRNSLKLEVNAELLYDCNYMMFQNSNFGDKWFYAFITNIEYVANQVSRIDYEIDVMQTWFPECELRPSFVEREHTGTDGIGVHRVEENIDYGEYYLRSLEPAYYATNHPLMDKKVVVVAVDRVPDDIYGLQKQYWIYGGVGTGLFFWIYEQSDDGVDSVNELLKTYVAGGFSGCNKDDIISVFQTPKIIWMDYDATTYTPPALSPKWAHNRYILNQESIIEARTYDRYEEIPDRLGGYEPRNKKLLQYPYNFLYVTDCRSASATYKYEDFIPAYIEGEQYCHFKYYMQGSCDSSMMLVPMSYKGADENYNEKMVYKGYPQNSFSSSLWEAYIAQNGGIIPVFSADYVTPTVDVVTSVANNTLRKARQMSKISDAVANGRTAGDIYERERMGREGNITATSAVARTLAYMGRNSAKKLMGNEAKGNYNGDIMYGVGLSDYYFGQMTIQAEYAERLDRFFDMYGYKINSVKIPNTHIRKHWTYTKVTSLNMIASIPQDAEEKIKDIFEDGIRFWKNPSEVGDFSVSLAQDNVVGAV